MTDARIVRAGTRLRTIPFSGEGDSARYRRTRYRLGPQRILHVRELAIVRAALARLPPGTASALDVPCGYGRILGTLAGAGLRCVGADLSPSQALHARATAPAIAANLLAGLPFADGAFDLVVSIRLLHHLRHPDDRAAALRELARVARRNVLLSYYGTSSLWSAHRKLMEGLRVRKPRIAVVTEEELLRDCRAVGLVRVAGWNVLPALHAHRFGLYARG